MAASSTGRYHHRSGPPHDPNCVGSASMKHSYAEDCAREDGAISSGSQRILLASLTAQLANVDRDNAAQLAEYVLTLRANGCAPAQLSRKLATFIGRADSHRILDWLQHECQRVGSARAAPYASPTAAAPPYSPSLSLSSSQSSKHRSGVPRVRDAREIIKGSAATPPLCNGDDAVPSAGLAALPPEELSSMGLSSGASSLSGLSSSSASSVSLGSLDQLNSKSRRKCAYYPHCVDKHCPHVHPNELCRYFPSCAFGDGCLYVHPVLPCRFQTRCSNPACNYQHSSPAASNTAAAGQAMLAPVPAPLEKQDHPNPNHRAKIVCKFTRLPGGCRNPNCSFEHHLLGSAQGRPTSNPPHVSVPALSAKRSANKFINVPCRFGQRCARTDCPYIHIDHSKGDGGLTVVEKQLPADDPMALDTNLSVSVSVIPEDAGSAEPAGSLSF